jgi:hypothetical protein
MSHVDILLDFGCFFYLELFVKNVIRFLTDRGTGWGIMLSMLS